MPALDMDDTRAVAIIAAYAEASRCVQIFKHAEAQVRPFEAWMLLPLGATFSDTIGMLVGTPIEGNAAEVYRGFFDTLLNRKAVALMAYDRYLARGTSRGTQH